uniref:G-protein coupled receptors family 2 profile 2 domain-containing protein n=1 Tax=Biomphalaria glabrata TaxID=6526 RepID=A0A2C9KJV5_BIOGL
MSQIGTHLGTPFWACYSVAGLLHYAVIAMFCWMLVEGFHLYVKLVWVFKVGSYLKKYLAVSWGFPLVVIVISMSVYGNQYKHNKLCWLHHDVTLICLVPVVSFVILMNSVILIIVLCVMIKSKNNLKNKKQGLKKMSNIKLSLKASLILLPLLGLTWVLGFFAVGSNGSEMMMYIVTYMFTAVNSCQGLLFFIFHGLLNLEIQAAFKRRYIKKKSESMNESTESRMRKLSFIDPDYDSTRNRNSPTFNMHSLQATQVIECNTVD